MPIFLLFLLVPLGGAGIYWTTRNGSGEVGDWKWNVKGGWTGRFHSWVTAPNGEVTVATPAISGESTFERAKIRALEVIAGQPGTREGLLAEELEVGIPATLVE
jgi:hypothetical protein